MPHLQILDGYRALAVLMVFLFHFYRGSLDAPLAWTQGGPLGVDIFFVLSGFLLTYSILRAREQGRFQLLDYWKRRLARIVPAYYVVMGAVIVSGVVLYNDWPSIVEVLTHLLFIHNFFPAYHGSLFSVEWTLGVEVQFYLLLPLIVAGLAYARWSRLSILLASLVISIGYKAILFTYLFPHWNVWDKFAWGTQLIGRIDQFILGSVACWIFLTLAKKKVNVLLLASGFVVTLYTLVQLYLYYGTIIHNFWETGWAVMYLPTIFGGLLAANMLCALLLCRTAWKGILWIPVHLLALYSYGIYLWHQPVITQVAQLSLSWQYDLVIIGGATLLLAVLSYHLIEKPIMTMVGRR